MRKFLTLVIFFAIMGGILYAAFVGIQALEGKPSIPSAWYVTKCYVHIGDKTSIFTSTNCHMRLKNGIMFIFDKKDEHLLLTTSQFTAISDDSIDPNVVAKPEKD